MVKHPREYRWSSYRVNAEGKSSELVSPHRQYLRLGRDDSERYAAYRSLFSTQLDEQTVRSIRDATNGGYVLGNSRFQSQVAETLGRRVVRGKAGRPVRPAAR